MLSGGEADATSAHRGCNGFLAFLHVQLTTPSWDRTNGQPNKELRVLLSKGKLNLRADE
jgi:hypothetical protein